MNQHKTKIINFKLRNLKHSFNILNCRIQNTTPNFVNF